MPKVSKTLADTLRERTATGQRRIAEKQAAEREQVESDDKKLQQQMQQRAEAFFNECKEEAGVAADEGKSEVMVTVMQGADEPHPRWVQYLSQYTCELLEKAGFSVKVEHNKMENMEPFGGDSMFYNTVYYTFLHINWNRSRR